MKTKRFVEKQNSGKPAIVDVVIETPKGSRNKFAYDPATGFFKLSKILAAGMIFPYDFGFVPATLADDGDPIDVLVLMEEPTFPGCLLECQLIGVIEARQKDPHRAVDRNDRLVAAATESVLYSNLTDLRQIPAKLIEQIEMFFVNYQKLRDVEFTIVARHGPERAFRLLTEAGYKNPAYREDRLAALGG